MKIVWKFLYLGVAYGFGQHPFSWAIGPHPLIIYKLVEYLRRKWLEDDWDL